jgi:type III pantothenate kinase
MVLSIDVGNTQILGGLFHDEDIILRFRKMTLPGTSSDEIGLFLRSVIRENGFNPDDVTRFACCSVVPAVNHSIGSACLKYFKLDPFFIRSGIKTGLKIKYNNPKDVGPDRIANAVAGSFLYPDKDLIIIDMGTATTFDVITADKTYLGGTIVPGMKMSMLALENGTARLPSVEIIKADNACGSSTIESIQAGLYFGQIGIIRELIHRIKKECFADRNPVILGTGGFSRLLSDTGLFHEIIPDLVLLGVKKTLDLNN